MNMKIQEITRILDLPNVRQQTPDTCGPASMKAVLGYYGIVTTEPELVKLTNMDFEWGAEPEDMKRVFEDFGLEVEIKKHMKVKDLRLCTQNKIPVLIVLQAWGSGEYEENYDDSHYVVVKGVDDVVVRFEDPSSDSESELPIDEFETRWHGWDTDVDHWGMIIGPGSRSIDPIHRWVERMG